MQSEGAGRGNQNQDLVLPPGTFAYMLENTKGQIRTLVGPLVFSPTAQDQPVLFNPEQTATTPFVPTDLKRCVQPLAFAQEGHYLVLQNPAAENRHPTQGREDNVPDLLVGRKINITGPETFALWPGQTAVSIEGHNLRSNQYLLVRVYNEEEAAKNWGSAVVKTVTPATTEDGSPVETSAVVSTAPSDLSVGKLYVIKGTEVSFYIPPTGVEVVADEETGSFVRDALTLERLEYAVLVDENGNKRYERGPSVTFPTPTESFIRDKHDSTKFRAVELNEIQGIYVKVIADYKEGSKEYKAGDELFITGETTPIYYPREEHSLIRYDGQAKTFATAVPSGEGRYVMDRMSGEITTLNGPSMLLPDPRTEVIVRRVLSDRESSLWYPENDESLEYNADLRQLMRSVPTTRGAVSEGEYARKKTRTRKTAAVPKATAMGTSGLLNSGNRALVADEFSRGSTYTQPRTVTLDTKYNGVPVINIWTGYAVMVINTSGERRVVEGPARIMMNYDDTLEVLSLSRGKPKTTDDVLDTVYLRTKNNKVSDIVSLETSDHVGISVKLSFRCGFEGEPEKWFEVENYVKYMTDHIRSVLKGATKQQTISDFYLNAAAFIRDTILGVKPEEGDRSGMFFEECGLRIQDVEVLEVRIDDPSIANLLQQEQHAVVNSNVKVERERRNLEFTKTLETIARQTQNEEFQTKEHANKLSIKQAESDLEVALTRFTNDVSKAAEELKVTEANEAQSDFIAEASLTRQLAAANQTAAIAHRDQVRKIEFLQAEAAAIIERFKALEPGFSAALTTLSNNETAREIAKATSVQRLLGGDTAVEILKSIFEGTGINEFIKTRNLFADANGVDAETVAR